MSQPPEEPSPQHSPNPKDKPKPKPKDFTPFPRVELPPEERQQMKRGEEEGFRFFIFGCAFCVAIILGTCIVLFFWIRSMGF